MIHQKPPNFCALPQHQIARNNTQYALVARRRDSARRFVTTWSWISARIFSGSPYAIGQIGNSNVDHMHRAIANSKGKLRSGKSAGAAPHRRAGVVVSLRYQKYAAATSLVLRKFVSERVGITG
jgi:hypothetical protein